MSCSPKSTKGIIRYIYVLLLLQLWGELIAVFGEVYIRSWSNKMADTGYVDCKRWFLGVYLLSAVTGLVLLYAVLLTICTCFLCRQLRWYVRNFGRQPPVPCRRLSASCCPSRRVCAVEAVCCCLGCKIALPVEQDSRSEGESCSILWVGASTDTLAHVVAQIIYGSSLRCS